MSVRGEGHLRSLDGRQYLRRCMAIMTRRVAALYSAGYVVAVAAIAFWPSPNVAGAAVSGVWDAMQAAGAPGWLSPAAVEFGLNVLFFVPLGLLGPVFRPRWRWFAWALLGLVAASVIELTQMVLLTERTPAVHDVVANTLGVLVGYLVVRSVQRGRADREPI